MNKKNYFFENWKKGYGCIKHTPKTIKRIERLKCKLDKLEIGGDGVNFYELLYYADRLTNAAMWLVVHDTYAKRVYLDGRALKSEDFKEWPEGHTGSALNIVPAYVGYLTANILTGHTRAWVVEQGHAVSGIDCVNLLVNNLTPEHAKRYNISEEGLSHFVQDFYFYRINNQGKQDSPRGSHVNAHTAGGLMEGGYLGFAGLQYVHMPLAGERLVVFLSDGAFEEQRGPDWASRWWRDEDCGLVTPIMINNGRRIDQRTTMNQMGGTNWLKKHLVLNGFEPIDIDGRDPASYACAIIEMEFKLKEAVAQIHAGKRKYPIKLPYGIATTIKGYGFYGQGTNAAHNLPLGRKMDALAIKRFNAGAQTLFVPKDILEKVSIMFQSHKNRPKEKDNPLVARDVKIKKVVEPIFEKVGSLVSPMRAVDEMFVAICKANPHLRPRIGNPDELSSNRMEKTLAVFKHRVTDPEAGISESCDGAVITALNEEAVASAALANKGGINIIVTYEAFGVKMHGIIRQEIIFTKHCIASGRPQKWISIPVILTSHTYENAKNEQSHQDPMLCEALLGEPAHISRVVFPPDFNTASVMMKEIYQTHGQIWSVVVPKSEVPVCFDPPEAYELVSQGGIKIKNAGYNQKKPKIVITAVGAYQLREVLKASKRLREKKIAHSVIYLFEPSRFSKPKDNFEEKIIHQQNILDDLYPASAFARLFVTHMRPDRIQGLLQSVITGKKNLALGYINEGGTLPIDGMLFVNRQSWAHCVEAVARLLEIPRDTLLSDKEIACIDNQESPYRIIF
ncbi:MAG: xylulose 5-phosphate 3-epimerase [Candidatus Omnitrophica bacterium]|nr:xylulose 5-phosphate 3-epimerase [Candidatus Omnitrophota bacterium]